MKEVQKYNLNRQEFFGLMMMYAANIDGEEHNKELAIIKRSIGDASYDRCSEVYQSMNDYELINYFRDHKATFLKSNMDEKMFLSELKTVVSADHHVDIMEKTLLLAIKKILNE